MSMLGETASRLPVPRFPPPLPLSSYVVLIILGGFGAVLGGFLRRLSDHLRSYMREDDLFPGHRRIAR